MIIRAIFPVFIHVYINIELSLYIVTYLLCNEINFAIIEVLKKTLIIIAIIIFNDIVLWDLMYTLWMSVTLNSYDIIWTVKVFYVDILSLLKIYIHQDWKCSSCCLWHLRSHLICWIGYFVHYCQASSISDYDCKQYWIPVVPKAYLLYTIVKAV